jgi:hypothetical protein
LILGGIAFLMCWVAIRGVRRRTVSGLGLMLGGIGLLVALSRKGAGIGWPIGGGAVSGLALFVGITQLAAIGAGAQAIREHAGKATSTNQEIVTSSNSTGPLGSDESGPADESSASVATPPEWVSARNAVRQGNIEVRVRRVVVGKVPLRGGFGDGETTSKDHLLAIHLTVMNRSRNKKVEYRSWQGSDVAFTRDYGILNDNFGNTYKRITFGFTTEIAGNTKSASIYPGRAVDDVLVFEPPIKGVQHLHLELPAKNFGGEAMLRLRIPAEMIQGQ